MATRIKPKQIRAGAENQVLTSVGGEAIWKDQVSPVLEKPRYADELPFAGGVSREASRGSNVKVVYYRAEIPEKYTGRKVKITTNTAFNIMREASQNVSLTPTIITELRLGNSILFQRSHQKRPYHTEMDTIVAITEVGASRVLNVKYIDRDNILNSHATTAYTTPEQIKIIIETVD